MLEVKFLQFNLERERDAQNILKKRHKFVHSRRSYSMHFLNSLIILFMKSKVFSCSTLVSL